MFEDKRVKLRLNSLRIKEKILNNKTNKKGSRLRLYKDYLYKNLKTLERIDCSSTRNKVEFELEHYTTQRPFDWQLEIVSFNNIFGIMLGMIDARNDEYGRDFEFFKDFNIEGRIESITKDQKELYEYRKLIIEHYLNIVPKNVIEKFPIILETVKTNPSYENFSNLYNNMREKNYQLSIQGEFISAYMEGYNNSLYVLPEEIIGYYKKLLLEYKNIKEQNKKQVEKIKNLNNKINNK